MADSVTAPVLSVTLDDGETVSLADCLWIMKAPCGCDCGCCVTRDYADDGWITSSAKALECISGGEKEAREDARDGFTVRLAKREEIEALGDCPHDPEWGRAS